MSDSNRRPTAYKAVALPTELIRRFVVKYIIPHLTINCNDYMVRMKGLEPPRLSTPEPKSGAATNYATSAKLWLLELGSNQ